MKSIFQRAKRTVPPAPRLYFAEGYRKGEKEPKYVVCQEYPRHVTRRILPGLSLEYLVGYVDGVVATANYKVTLVNGMPSSKKRYFKLWRMKPVSPETLERAFHERTTILMQYPYLLSPEPTLGALTDLGFLIISEPEIDSDEGIILPFL